MVIVNQNMDNRIEENDDSNQNDKNTPVDAQDVGLPGFQIVLQNKEPGNAYQKRYNG
jgi:hypothetical protein